MAVQGLVLEQRVVVPVRRLWVVAVLSVVTLGVYAWFWYYWTNREMRDFGHAYGDERLAASRPGRSVLAITLGALVVVPAMISLVRAIGRIQACERAATGRAVGRMGLVAAIVVGFAAAITSGVVTGGAAVVASLLAMIAQALVVVLMQRRLNAVWRCASGSGAR